MQNIGSPPPAATGEDIKTLYEANEDTNAFTDEHKKKIDGDITANTIVNQKNGEALDFWLGTQAEYDALPAKDATTLYMVKE